MSNKPNCFSGAPWNSEVLTPRVGHPETYARAVAGVARAAG
jgi:hypothetical protein